MKKQELRITLKFKQPLLKKLEQWRREQIEQRGSYISWQAAVNEILHRYLEEKDG